MLRSHTVHATTPITVRITRRSGYLSAASAILASTEFTMPITQEHPYVQAVGIARHKRSPRLSALHFIWRQQTAPCRCDKRYTVLQCIIHIVESVVLRVGRPPGMALP